MCGEALRSVSLNAGLATSISNANNDRRIMHARGAERICARARLELTRRGCRVVKPVAGEIVVIPFQVERVVPTRCKSSAANIAGALGFETRSQPSSLAPTLVTLPSMSRVPRAPFTKTESSAYAPASASILFPAFRFAAERRDSLDRLAKRLAASRRKVASRSLPATLDRYLTA
jgi:hypothetical protein